MRPAAATAGVSIFTIGFADRAAELGHRPLAANQPESARRAFTSALAACADHPRAQAGLAL